MTRDELIETMADIIQGKRYIGAMWSSEEISVNLLTAIESAGLAIVPVEATVGMICDGIDSAMNASIQEEYTWPYYVADIYDSMVKEGRT